MNNRLMSNRREMMGMLLAGSAMLTLSTCASVGKMGTSAVDAVKKLLKVASSKALGKLGAQGGFASGLSSNDLLGDVGGDGLGGRMIALADSLGLMKGLDSKINRVAEMAADKAAPFIVDQIGGLSVADANAIINGPEDGATQLLKSAISNKLSEQLVPSLSAAVEGLGVLKDVQKILGVGSLPLDSLGLDRIVGKLTGKVGGSIFDAIANEERAIRRDPKSTGDADLIRIFGKK
jgi:hypothetical protein